MPGLIETYNQYKDQGLEVIAVAMYYDPPSRVISFTKNNNLPFPVVLDTNKEIISNNFKKQLDDNFKEILSFAKETLDKMLNIKGEKTVDYFHKKLGKIMWEYAGMSRSKEGLDHAIQEIKNIREEFWTNVKIPGSQNEMNKELEKAGRVADFLELGELFAKDALERTESAGGHFREESQTPEGEALRNDKDFAFTSAWEYIGEPSDAILHKEHLEFNDIELKQRSYK